MNWRSDCRGFLALLAITALLGSSARAQSGVNDRIQAEDFRVAGLGSARSVDLYSLGTATPSTPFPIALPAGVLTGIGSTMNTPYVAGYGSYAASPSCPGPTPSGASLPQPSLDSPPRVGQRVKPGCPPAALMIGTQVVGHVPHDTVLSVWEVRGPWIGTAIEIEGREVRGWIHVDQLNPAVLASKKLP